MRFSPEILLAVAGLANAASQSICDKYTTALLKQNTAANQYTLLKLLVNTALIGNFTGPGTAQSSLPGSMVPVAGILASSGPLLGYFDGSLNDINLESTQTGSMNGPGALNFLDGGGAAPILKDPTSAGAAGSNQNDLITHLWSYFGALLGCSGYGTSDFPSYSGDPSMYNVHKYMDIDEAGLTYFIDQVGDAALSFGASQSDVDTVAMALTNAFGYRCAPPAAVVATVTTLQAICIASDCPIATASPVCASYQAAVSPAPASAASSMAASAPASYATPSMPMASQISDGQVQATTAVSAYTGAAAMPTYGAQIALAAGAIAAAML